VVRWIEQASTRSSRRSRARVFGASPLLNTPVIYLIAEQSTAVRRARRQAVRHVITNGLLLTPEFVERMLGCGLNGIKVTLDGDRDTHNRMRPLRAQGTFDRIIENVVSARCADVP